MEFWRKNSKKGDLGKVQSCKLKKYLENFAFQLFIILL